MLRPRYIPPRDIFPTDPWVLEAVRFDSKLAYEFAGQAETMFALSNGYLGMRGMIEDGMPVKEPGVFLNGFYEHRPISYGEQAYGFPRVGQSILTCPDGTVVKLFVDDEPFVLTKAEDGTLRAKSATSTTTSRSRLIALRVHRELRCQ